MRRSKSRNPLIALAQRRLEAATSELSGRIYNGRDPSALSAKALIQKGIPPALRRIREAVDAANALLAPLQLELAWDVPVENAHMVRATAKYVEELRAHASREFEVKRPLLHHAFDEFVLMVITGGDNDLLECFERFNKNINAALTGV